jgi:hypothetical protein
MKNYLSLRSHYLIMIAIIFSSSVYSQNQTLNNIEVIQPAFTSSDDLQFLMGNRIYPSDKIGVDDNVLLFPGWQKGIVNFNNGKQLKNVSCNQRAVF